jgi:hypothetical protein
MPSPDSGYKAEQKSSSIIFISNLSSFGMLEIPTVSFLISYWRLVGPSSP